MFTSFLQPSISTVKTPKVGLKVGNIAPEITLLSPEGIQIPLSSLRGKVVYIDFWASWCKGCRIVSKKLKPIYDTYKDKQFIEGDGFQIFSVNLDTDRNIWLSVINQDSMQSYVNVSDLKGFHSPVALDYGLKGLPVGYLIDGNGIILNTRDGLLLALDKFSLK